MFVGAVAAMPLPSDWSDELLHLAGHIGLQRVHIVVVAEAAGGTPLKAALLELEGRLKQIQVPHSVVAVAAGSDGQHNKHIECVPQSHTPHIHIIESDNCFWVNW